MKKFLIVGIGNIGKEYDNTRHNVGFQILDYISKEYQQDFEIVKYGQISKFRIKFNKYFFIIRQNYFRKLVGHATKYRYVTLSATLSVLIIVLGLMSGGRVSFVFFPSPEPDIIYVNFNFSPGTSKENTSSMITELEKSLLEVDHNKEVKTYFSIIGKSLGLPGSVQQIQGQHIGAMVVELVSSDSRITEVSDLIIRWKKNINKILY